MPNQSRLLAVVALLLVAAGGFLVLREDQPPTVRWDATAEQEVPAEPADAQAAGGEDGGLALERTESALPAVPARPDERVDLLLRGRVVDAFRAPVAGATVWLDFGRGGRGGGNRQRRVPEPVTTDGDGRFAFQGQTFRNLRVWLQVAHQKHAPAQFDKDVGNVAAELDLGELVLTYGGQIRGRVTDLEGNGIGGATLRLQAENDNPLRMLRDRDKLTPPFTTDAAGYYVAPHVAAGAWSLAATAKAHTEGRTATFTVEEQQIHDLDDIRLGPGFEVTGYVHNARGEPVAKAEVTLQGEAPMRGRARGGNGPTMEAPAAGVAAANPGRGGFGGFGGFGGGNREHTATTDAQGRFFLEHLPGVAMRVDVRASGYLDLRQDGVDPKLGQPLHLTLQDGLRIDGRVVDGDGKPVTRFAARAVRVRGLAADGAGAAEAEALVAQLRSGNLDEATRATASARLQQLREQGAFGGGGGRGGPGGRGGFGGDQGNGEDGNGRFGAPRDLGEPENHPGGTFALTGLQEGVYEVHVQSPEHTRYRSPEVTLRVLTAAPMVDAALDGGVFVAGVVRDQRGEPVAGARVELRTPSPWEGRNRGGRGGRGGDANAAPAAAGGPGGQGGGPGGNRDTMRTAMLAQVSLETTSDADGTFVIKHAPRGTFRLQAEAKGFAVAQLDGFEVQGDRSGVELRLGALGTLAGRVRGLGRGEAGEARVYAVPMPANGGGFGGMMGRGRGGPGGGGGPFASATVDAEGDYTLGELTPGDYLVRCWVGSMQDMMRELAPQFFGGNLVADATVRAGETTRLDLTALRAQVGTVAGVVLHNGKPGSGFQVELTRIDDTGAVDAGGGNQGGRGGRGGGPGNFGGGGFNRQFQATTAQSGKFTLQKVPAGSYRLRVNSARRGGTLHEEIVQVLVDATTEPMILLTTHALAGAVTRDDGGKPEELAGRVTLLAGLDAAPADLNAYMRENPGFDARLQNGAFRFDALKPGNYLLVVTVRGRERTVQPVLVAGDVALQVPAGKPAAATDAATGGAQGGRGVQGAGPGGRGQVPGAGQGGTPGARGGQGARPQPGGR